MKEQDGHPLGLYQTLKDTSRLIKAMQPYCTVVQYTGRLRLLEPRQQSPNLKILAAPRPIKDIVGDDMTQQNQLTARLTMHKPILKDAKVTIKEPHYTIEWKNRIFTVEAITKRSKIGVAQIINTGSPEFLRWLLSKTNDDSPLPWSYFVDRKTYELRISNSKIKHVPTENSLFKALNLRYLTIEDRWIGDRDYWNTFKNVS